MEVGSNIPVRLREDLDTGFLDFHDYQETQPDSEVFYNISTMFPCHHGMKERNSNFDK